MTYIKGNLTWKNDGWHINGHGEIKVGDVIEVAEIDGSWSKITVGQDANKIFHPEPAGTPFNTDMHVRRVKL